VAASAAKITNKGGNKEFFIERLHSNLSFEPARRRACSTSVQRAII
jgi:hypothetical protein